MAKPATEQMICHEPAARGEVGEHAGQSACGRREPHVHRRQVEPLGPFGPELANPADDAVVGDGGSRPDGQAAIRPLVHDDLPVGPLAGVLKDAVVDRHMPFVRAVKLHHHPDPLDVAHAHPPPGTPPQPPDRAKICRPGGGFCQPLYLSLSTGGSGANLIFDRMSVLSADARRQVFGLSEG